MKKRVLSVLLALLLVTGIASAALAAGGDHTVTVKAGEHGKVSADGVNWSDSVQVTVPDGGKLGDSLKYQPDYGYEFDKAVMPAGVSSVAAGRYFSVIIDGEGGVWTAGANDMGQLGRSDNTKLFEKVTIGTADNKAVAVAAGSDHTVVLDEQGRVWTAGDNAYGQLGIKDGAGDKFATHPYFTQVTDGIGDTKIVAIAAGYYSTVLLDENGKVWTAGANDRGQLGRPENAGVFNSFDLEPPANPTFAQVTGDIGSVKIVGIASGMRHLVALDEEGKVWTAGQKVFGMTGRAISSGYDATMAPVTDGIGGVKIKSVYAEQYSTFLLDESGKVWAAGSNSYAELGLPKSYGSVYTFTPVTDGLDGAVIASVVPGQSHVVLIDVDGNAYSAGMNGRGQLGRTTSAQIVYGLAKITDGVDGVGFVGGAGGAAHTLLVDGKGVLRSSGSNEYYQLGRDENKGTANANKVFDKVTTEFNSDYSLDALKDHRFGDDTTVTIHFKERARIKVDYELDGGEWIDGYNAPDFYFDGDSFTPPAADKLVKKGHVLQNWSCLIRDGVETYYAVWEAKLYDLTWNADGGTLSGDYTSGKVRYGAKITAPTAERAGYRFIGWDAEVPSTMPDENVTLTARWQLIARMPDRELVIYYKSVGKLNTITDDPSLVEYTSSDESVVTVDKDGTYKAVGRGSAVITMHVIGTDIEEHCTITVKYTWWQVLIRIFLLGFIWY